MSPYDILGVDRDATPEQIAKAYRDRSLATHPDHGGDPEQFKRVQLAYETLSDAEKRQRFDTTGEFEPAEDVIAETIKALTREVFTMTSMPNNPIRWMRDQVDRQRASHESQRSELVRQIEVLTRRKQDYLERTAKTTNTAARALMLEQIEDMLASLAGAVEAEKAQIEQGTRILAYMNGLEYERAPDEFGFRSRYDWPALNRPRNSVLAAWAD